MQESARQSSPLTPAPGESYEDFVVRAHTALILQVTDPAERNAAVWGMWEQTNGDPERQRAEARFADGYETIPMVPLFVEHEKVSQGPGGIETVTNYDVAELTAIIRENNFRIEDTDAYTGLVDRHTVPAGARDPIPPKTLGYVGPFRLGMLGRKHPRFAIFADEHHRRDRAITLADRPRRSVEVLKLKANGRRYIDPIACLAEAPRLPLPVHHYTAKDAVVVERYAALAPQHDYDEPDRYDGMAAGIGGGSYAGGGNTFIAKHVQTRDRNAAGVGKAPSMHDQDPAGTVRQVIDALQSTEEWQALTQFVQMMKQQETGAGDLASGGAPMPEAMAGDDPADPGGFANPGVLEPSQPGGPRYEESMAGVGDGGAMAGPPPMGKPNPMAYPEGMQEEAPPLPGPGQPPAMPDFGQPEPEPAMGGGALAAMGAGGSAPAMGGPMGAAPDGRPLGQPAGETPGMPAIGEDASAASQTLLVDPEEPDRNNPLLAVAAPMVARAAAPAIGRVAGAQAAKAVGGGAARQAIARTAGSAAGSEATHQLGKTLSNLRSAAATGIEDDRNAGVGEHIAPAVDAVEELAVGPLSKPATGNSRFSAMGGSYNGHHRYQAPNPEVSDVNATATPIPTVDQYEALAAENENLRQQLAAQGAELTSVSAQNDSILTEQAEHYAALQYQVVELTQDRTDSNRRGRLLELSGHFPIVVVDEEAARCLYSAGSEMTDADFDAHLDTIERYAAAAAIATPMIPIGIESNQEPARLDVETARYAADTADRALEIVNESIRKGERIDYTTAVEKAKAEKTAA